MPRISKLWTSYDLQGRPKQPIPILKGHQIFISYPYEYDVMKICVIIQALIILKLFVKSIWGYLAVKADLLEVPQKWLIMGHD